MKTLIADEVAAGGGSSSTDPIFVRIAIDNASLFSGTWSNGASDPLHKLYDAIPNGTYVAYDLSGCTFTSIDDASGAVNSARSPVKNYLVSITLPDTLISIGDYAFFGCFSLTTVTIPSGVTAIGNYVFYGCTGLTTVIISSGVTSIGNYVFRGCTGLTSVTIPSGVTAIGNNVFDGCTGLSSVTIPSSVTTIGNYAFQRCTGLTTVTIPSSVTAIGDYAFYDCGGLTSVYVLREAEPLTTLGNTIVFYYTHASLVIYVPASKEAAYKAATNWSTYLAKIQAGAPPAP
jgi:hypothetical protein